MIDERLRQDTKRDHAALEKAMMPLLRSAVTADAYATLLRRLYGYVRPVEAAVAHRIDAALLPDAVTRRHADRLLQDLDALKAPRHPLPEASRIPQDLDADTARAWGALYVLEGSTLGGQVVRTLLLRQFPGAAGATNYFDGYGAETPHRWASFKTALNNWLAAHPQHADAIIDGARDTFTTFQAWLQAPTLPA